MQSVTNKKIVGTLIGMAILVLLDISSMAHAELEIEITRGRESATPIAIVPFEWQSAQPQSETDVAKVIGDDLGRSGLFRTVREADLIEQPKSFSDIRFGTWRLLDVNYLLIGRIRDQAPAYSVEFELYDIVSEQRVAGYALPVREGALRDAAHQVADLVYEALTGTPGAFSTRIAYVIASQTADGLRYRLQVADADGFRPRSIVESREPLLSPAWSPDGRQLAYVSFESGNSSIYLQEIATGSRTRIASHKGINGAPSFSPDGKKLALALSKTGNLEIYVMDLGTGGLRQLTNHWGIDTEPVWTDDGQSVIFTSDRGGKPQLYQVSINNGTPRRVTREGDYNARATIAPGKGLIAMAHGVGNVYRIAVLNQETGLLQIVSDGTLDESPSFAPNGSMILYASREGMQGVLSAVSADGRVRQRLVLSGGDVREPAWSPLPRR